MGIVKNEMGIFGRSIKFSGRMCGARVHDMVSGGAAPSPILSPFVHSLRN